MLFTIGLYAGKIGLSCLVVFILCLVGDNIYANSREPVPEWIKLTGVAAFLLCVASFVVWLLTLIWL